MTSALLGHIRRMAPAAILLFAVLLFAGCQPLPHPFADDVPRRGSPMLTLRDSTSVTIAPI